MRGNNKRKLIPKYILANILKEYQLGVPLTKLIANYNLEVSRPHLRKLLFIYIDILNDDLYRAERRALHNAIFPKWLDEDLPVTEQPDTWTYKGKFPHGEWRMKDV